MVLFDRKGKREGGHDVISKICVGERMVKKRRNGRGRRKEEKEERKGRGERE